MKTAVIIPAYNEELTIREVILGFHRAAPEADIVVINNNSRDATLEIAEKTFRENSISGKVMTESRQGKAYAVRKAFQETEASVYVMVDADLTYSAGELDKLIRPVAEGQADMIVGDRLSGGTYSKQNKRAFHGFGNHLVRDMINGIFRAKLKDIMSGYRVFSRKFVKNFPILSEGFEIETEMTLHALDKRFQIVEIPTPYVDRPAGSESKLNTFKDGFRVIRTIIGIFKNYRPMVFFGILALLCLGLSMLAGIPPVLEYLQYHYVYKVPSAVLAMGLAILAILLGAVGLILDTVVKLHHFEYEWKLNQYRDNP